MATQAQLKTCLSSYATVARGKTACRIEKLAAPLCRKHGREAVYR
jgi:hypothetical protein